MNARHIRNGMVIASLLLAAGCSASIPPNELVTARQSYARAAAGPAAQLAQADLDSAKKGLDRAEASFKEDGVTPETKDIAYAAGRMAELSESRARTIHNNGVKDKTNATSQANAVNQAQVTSAQLVAAKGQLATEQERRAEAERRAAQAAADLAKFASVKQDPVRGMVITLSGGVLFESAKWQLLPGAQTKLNDVADALTKQDVDSAILVEGHTDSQGKDAANQELSQKRAESVRAYLVTRGIATDRVTASGLGPGRPIADNTSPEGRANNRRVEIVVKPKR